MDLTSLLSYLPALSSLLSYLPTMSVLLDSTVLKWVFYLWLFYAGFAVSVSVYRLWQKGTLNMLNKILFGPILIVFVLVDVLINYTVLLLVFGRPPEKTYTITDRLYVYHNQESGFKKRFASFVCEKLLNPVDPTGTHC
jgi:hypothetical protein